MAVAVDAQLDGALQENVLALAAWHDKHCLLVRGAVPASLFSTAQYRTLIARIYGYIDAHRKAPKEHLPDLVEDLLSKDTSSAELLAETLHAVSRLGPKLNAEYVVGQLEKFVRSQTLRGGLIAASELIQAGRVEEAEVEVEKSLRHRLTLFDPGVTLDTGLRRARSEAKDPLLTGLPDIDHRHLGPARKEMHLFIAPPKRGKSWWLVHLAKRAIMQRLSVVYVSLELSEELVAQRCVQALYSMTKRETVVRVPRFEKDSLGRLTNIEQDVVKRRPSLDDDAVASRVMARVQSEYWHDRVRVKSFPTSSLTVNGLRAYLDALDRLHHLQPDILLLDYADLMRVDSKNYRIDLGALYRELRGLAVERNLMLVTASQSNRAGAHSKTVQDTNVAEDFSKIATADCVLTYAQTEPERQLQLARLYLSNGRTDEDRFTILISQAYPIGQFCLDSIRMSDSYWSQIEAAENEEEEEDEKE